LTLDLECCLTPCPQFYAIVTTKFLPGKPAGYYRRLLQGNHHPPGRDYELIVAETLWPDPDALKARLVISTADREAEKAEQLKERQTMKRIERKAVKAALPAKIEEHDKVAKPKKAKGKATPKGKVPRGTSKPKAKPKAPSHVRYANPATFKPEDFPGYTRKPGLSKKGSVVLIRDEKAAS